jgi:hypothetical protein
MSAKTLSNVRAKCPSHQQAAFDAEMAKLDAAQQDTVLTWIQELIALLTKFGGTINFQCIISSLPSIAAGFEAFMAAYFACVAVQPKP